MAEHDVPFSIDSFIDKLLSHVSASGGWEQVGLRAVARSRRVPVPSFICRPLRAAQSPLCADVTGNYIARVSNSNVSDMSTTNALKDEMLKIVRDVGSINLFRLVIDPHEFGRSVENIFYLSCLFHDGVCGFHVNEDEEPIVTARNPTSDRLRTVDIERHQMVLEFDMPTWRRAIEVFDIAEAVMPRPSDINI